MSLTGAVSQFTVPAGTDVELSGQVDKELVSAVPAAAVAAARRPGSRSPWKLTDDRLGFRRRFDNVTAEQDFDLEFTDTDNVVARRHVRIEPIKDGVPRVNLLIEGIRKTAQGYMVTPVAMIPFAGSVADNAGLDKIEYLDLSGWKPPAWSGRRRRWRPLPSRTSPRRTWPAWSVRLWRPAKPSALAAPDAKPLSFPLQTFAEVLRERRLKDVVKEVSPPPQRDGTAAGFAAGCPVRGQAAVRVPRPARPAARPKVKDDQQISRVTGCG